MLIAAGWAASTAAARREARTSQPETASPQAATLESGGGPCREPGYPVPPLDPPHYHGAGRAARADWHEPIAAALEATAPDQVSHHDLFRLDPVPGYVHGRTALLGDAAHAQTPDLGQGACQAIEDAVILDASLTQHDDPLTALARYDEQRRPRTQAMARAAQQIHQLNARHFHAVLAAARVMPPSLWQRQITRWTEAGPGPDEIHDRERKQHIRVDEYSGHEQ